MPYIPYWFELFAPCFSWIVPAIALTGLWVARASNDRRVQCIAERAYFSAMFLVAAATLRTVVTDEGCWLLHMASMGVMVLGATIPKTSVAHSDFESDVAWSET
jgi:hypothetical protein